MSKTNLPREITKWLQSLNLSFKITNLRRDFTNGFLVAEILSRSNPDGIHVNMSGFSPGLSTENKKSNWTLLKFLFKDKTCKTPMKDDLIERIINQAPNAAYEYLLLLYKTIQNKE